MRNLILFALILLGCTSKSSYKADLNNNKVEISEKRNPIKGQKFSIEMVKKNGVYYIPVEVNGSNMSFIFDTGASTVTISELEAAFLVKQGTLSEKDIIGETKFKDANGDISDGTVIILHSLKIGERELKNVEASIVHNQKAPLLLGQTFIERFGKVSIDYNKGILIFE